MKKLFIVFFILMLVIFQVSAFSWPWAKKTSQDTVKHTETAQISIIPEKALVNVGDALTLVNSNEIVKSNLKYFVTDYFCVKTEERELYFGIDGNVVVETGKPSSCYKIKVSEDDMKYFLDAYKANKYISYDDAMSKVDTSLGLKMKILKIKLSTVFK